MNKRRVVIITNLYPNPQEPGRGIFIRQLVEEIAHDWDVVVVAPAPWLPRVLKPYFPHAIQLPAEEIIGGIRVYHPAVVVIPKIARSLYGLLFFCGILPLLRKLQREFKPDLISAHWIYPDGFGATLAARTLKLPIVLHALGCDINESATYPRRKQMIQWAVRQADRVIVKSSDIGRKIVAMGTPQERVRVLLNGVDQTRFVPIPMTTARQHLGLDPIRHYLLFIGNFQIEKGLCYLLDAMALVHAQQPEVELLVIGGGRLQDEIEAQLQRLGLGTCVHLFGRVAHDQIPHYLSAANLLCLPSLREGCPNVVLESLSCGTPVVASEVGAVPDIITRPEWGLAVPPQNPAALASGIQQCLNLKDRPIPPFRWFSWRENAEAVIREFLAVIAGRG